MVQQLLETTDMVAASVCCTRLAHSLLPLQEYKDAQRCWQWQQARKILLSHVRLPTLCRQSSPMLSACHSRSLVIVRPTETAPITNYSIL